MNDENTPHDDTARTQPREGAHRGDGGRCRATGMGRRARLGIAAAGLIGIGAALGALAAVSGAVGAHGFGGFHGAHGLGGHHGAHTLESMTERALERTAWVLGRVDATPGQEEQMNALVTGLVTELEPLHREHREHRRAVLGELLRPEVDRGALETLRLEELRLLDAASARVTDAVVDASHILTPEQRDELLSRFERREHAR